MKRALCLLVILLICLLCAVAQAETEGRYTYTVNEDNTVTITKYDWKNNPGDIYIPEMLGNRMVTGIGDQAFATKGNTAVKITLPDTIKSIGKLAFRGAAITYVNIPMGVKEIGGGAFAECSVMQFRVEKGHDTFATIDNALYNKQTKTLIAWPTNKEIDENTQIPDGIVSIGSYVFYNRSFGYVESGWIKRAEFKLPDSVVTIEPYAFSRSRYLFMPTPQNLESIGAHAFEECKDLHWDTLSMKKVRIDDFAFNGCYFTTASIDVTNAVSIGNRAFSNVEGLHNGGILIRGYGVYHIGEDAFRSKNTLGKGTRIDGGGFNHFDGAKITFNNPQLETVSPRAFMNVVNLEELYIVNGAVKAIGSESFENCSDLEKADLSGVVTIEAKAFAGCTSLEEVNLGQQVESIGDYAFQNTKISNITIPATVTMIGNKVFDGCPKNLSITVEGGSYAEVWVRTSGYAYTVNGQEDDTSWLND